MIRVWAVVADGVVQRVGGAAEMPPGPGWVEVKTGKVEQGWVSDGKGGWMPSPEPVPASVSLRQLLFALRDGNWISHDEAMAAARTGEMPGPMVKLLEQAVAAKLITAQAAEDAALTWASLYTAERADALWGLFIAAGSATAAQVDDLFRDAGGR